VKYACITQHRTQYPVKMMCRVLSVSRSGYYAAQDREPSDRSTSDGCLRLEIRAIHRESKQRYGSPRVHDELRARDVRCGRNRVARLMRLEGLRSRKRRRFRVTTNSDHTHAPAPNLVERLFAVGQQMAADRSGFPTLPTLLRVKVGCISQWSSISRTEWSSAGPRNERWIIPFLWRHS
jgi:transposase InsO family protein